MRGRVHDVELDALPALLREAGNVDLLYVLLREQGRPVGRLVLERPGTLDPASLRRLAQDAASSARPQRPR